MWRVGVVLMCGVLAALPAEAAAEAHDHRGKIAPFPSKPPRIDLTAAEEQTLSSGGSVQKQVRIDTGGRGFVVQDIAAPVEVVMDRILDFPAYPRMVPNLKSSSVYDKSRGSPETIKVAMEVAVLGFSMKYYIDHRVYRGTNVITWTLDYDIKSELDESVGYWHVARHPSKPQWSRVSYSVGILLAPWVPGVVVNIMTKQALSAATTWVKRESEKAAPKPQVSTSGFAEAVDVESATNDIPPAPKLGYTDLMRKYFDDSYETVEEKEHKALVASIEGKRAAEARRKKFIRNTSATLGTMVSVGAVAYAAHYYLSHQGSGNLLAAWR